MDFMEPQENATNTQDAHTNKMLSKDFKSRTIHIKTFGCQMNVYDSDRMMSILMSQGFSLENELRKADVILINTCAIRDKAEHKVLSLLGELKPIKDKRPETVIGVTGCVGQRIGRKLLQKVPHLDLVMGPDSVDRIGSIVSSVLSEGKRILEAKLDDVKNRTYSQPGIASTAKPSEFLTIMKGCDHFCSYCIVPFVRGREKSRPIEEVINDVRGLVAKGTKEVIFLGQNINTYGKGTSFRLSQLIEAVAEVKDLFRVRYVTSHPRDLGQDLIDQFGKIDKLCPALHLPVQSGSDKILKKMGRLYSSSQYLGKVEALRSSCPGLALSADFIVGFPGETDEDFTQTLSLVEKVGFSTVFSFKYSPRPGTRAFSIGEEVPESVMDLRLRQLQQVTSNLILKENLAKVGLVEDVLVESIDKKNLYYSGRTPHNKVVHVLNAGDACLGKIIPVEITHATASNLRGYYINAPRFNRADSEGNKAYAARTA